VLACVSEPAADGDGLAEGGGLPYGASLRADSSGGGHFASAKQLFPREP